MYKSEIHFDENQDEIDRPSIMDLNQLASSLKSAIFSKYFSDYLIEKIEEMWDLYEKRIDQYLQEKHFDTRCHHQHSPLTVYLQELIKHEQEHILTCQREIEILCSSREQKKYSVRQASANVPRTPRCIDRYENTIDQ